MRAPITKLYWMSLALAAVLVAVVVAQGQTVSTDDAPGSGAIAAVTVQVGPVADAGTELFVPQNRINVIGTLEIRHDVVIDGPPVKLRDICRWSIEQSASFLPIADLVIDRLTSKRPKKITLDELRTALHEAGVNQGLIQFTGSTSCMVSCADSEAGIAADDQGGDRGALNQWLKQNSQKTAPPVPTATSNLPPAKGAAAAGTVNGSDVDASSTYHTLRDLLLTDLSQRLNIPVDRLQMTIDPKDNSLLNLSEPTFQFQLDPRRVRDLGRVSWDISILTGRSTQKITIDGEARAWETQLVTAKPVSYHQVLREQDVTTRRVLLEHVDDDPVLTRDQVIGQQAARDLQPGTVMTARMVQGVPLASTGQYVTINLVHGGVQISTVGRALESGGFGQTIRVQNDSSNEVYEVTLTGPQTGVMGPG